MVQSVINVNEGVTEEHGMDDLFQLLEIEYFISFSRIMCHNVHFGHTGELSQLANIILDILSQLQTLYKEHSVWESKCHSYINKNQII